MNCVHCGANLSLDDMTRPNCPYCKNVLKHHAQAAEHAALVNKIMADRIGAQYPGMPPGNIPQIGYGFGAPLDPSFQRFQEYQTQQAFRWSRSILILALVLPLVLSLVVGGIVVAMFLLR